MAFAQPRILYGVPFYTMDGQGTVVECVVTAGGRILFSGSAEEAVRRFPRAEREELQLGCVVPGFVDAHIHLKAYSLVYRDIDLTGAADPGEALERVKKAASSKKEGEWIRGGGVEERLLRSLGRRELDEAAPQSPLVLFNADLRAALANTPALSLAGIDEHRRDPLGGSIERDPGGAPTGVLRERALELVRGAMPAQSGGEVDHAVERGIRSLLSRGITCVCDCSSNPGDSPVSSIMKLWHRDRLELRAVLMFGEQESSRLGVLGFPSRFGDERVRIGGCKLLADGSLASRTGLMSRPYRGEETTGMQLMGEDELYEAMRRLYTRYLWTAVHAVGDRANRTVLNAYERLRRDRGMPRLLMRVEHAQALQDEEVQRFASLGVFAVGNPALIPQDRAYAIRFLGTEAGLLHRFGSLMEAGARLAFGSNAPAGPVSPLHGILLAVERKGAEEGPELRFFPRERLSLEDAVYAYTAGAAAAVGLEEGGSLEPGKVADMVHLSLDIFRGGGRAGRLAGGAEALLRARVVRTYVGGEPVYERRAGEGVPAPAGGENGGEIGESGESGG